MSNPIITADQLTKSYTVGKKEVSVLRGASLEIHQGEKVFLCGPSGAGKTTLMYALAGLEKPDSGIVTIAGKNVYQLPKKDQANLRNDKLSYIFQNYYLLPELTALENVLIPSLISGNKRNNEAIACLERVGLGDRIDHLPAELSGGEQQRVAIARSLINSPAIIFADEPTGNLDSRNGAEIMQLLFQVSEEEKNTLVIVTHDSQLATTGDRTLRVSDGIVQEQAS